MTDTSTSNDYNFIINSCEKNNKDFWIKLFKITGKNQAFVNWNLFQKFGYCEVTSPFFDSVNLNEDSSFHDRILNTILEKSIAWKAVTANGKPASFDEIHDVLCSGMTINKKFQTQMLWELIKNRNLKNLNKNEVCQIIEDVWVNVEYNSSNIDIWKKIHAAFPLRGYNTETLPNSMMVYRAGEASGMSWSLNLEVANWFAQRFDENREIHKKMIFKSDILFYTNKRSEEEVVIFG